MRWFEMLVGVTAAELLASILELDSLEHVTNFYRGNGCCPLPTDTAAAPVERQSRLRDHLKDRLGSPLVLVGEAAGWRGARQTGIPFTSPAQLGGVGSEGSATIVKRALADLGLEDEVLLWNACLLHPHRAGSPESNVAPPALAVDQCLEVLEQVMSGKLVVAIGRRAERAVSRIRGAAVKPAEQASAGDVAVAVRHPSFGGADLFRAGLRDVARRLS